ncbi:MAG: flavin reductase [Christensenellales bacterium]
MDPVVMFKISYGLYILSAKEGEKDNGCVINTAIQVTDNPIRVTVALSKLNYTHDMILRTNAFNLSMLSETVPFEMFKVFGFQSGAATDKFKNIQFERSSNGVPYLMEHTSAYLACKVVSVTDIGTHSMFLADVEDGLILSTVAPVTYSYYHKYIKPQPAPREEKGFRCRICGYVYEGDVLPDDFICPWCKHTSVDFERIQHKKTEE